MAKRSSAVPDSFEVNVVSLLRGQVDAIVHELAVAISDIQSGFPGVSGRLLSGLAPPPLVPLTGIQRQPKPGTYARIIPLGKY